MVQLYGRGYTEAPQGKYENSLYIWQLLGVLDKLGWRDPVYLAGLSMVSRPLDPRAHNC